MIEICVSNIFIILILGLAECKEFLEGKVQLGKRPLPYFRRKVEGLLDDANDPDDSRHIASFLEQNIKEVINKIGQDGEPITKGHDYIATVAYIQKENRPTVVYLPDRVTFEEDDATRKYVEYRKSMELSNDVDRNYLPNETLESLTTIYQDNVTTLRPKDLMWPMDKNMSFNSMNLLPFVSKDKSSNPKRYKFPLKKSSNKNIKFRDPDDSFRDWTDLRHNSVNYKFRTNEGHYINRSCIICDNLAEEHCSVPKNKFIPATLCTHLESICYSMHTPFGIVDRGCFNPNHNLTTFVCACNLCNQVSILDMPILFPSKRDWIANVYELSHAKRLRKSTNKDMSCLKCEVNGPSAINSNDNRNCLQGLAASLPVEVCKDNEICGVKAIRGENYIWRGCINFPLFNYYFTLCDSNLCNDEPIVSVYDST